MASEARWRGAPEASARRVVLAGADPRSRAMAKACFDSLEIDLQVTEARSAIEVRDQLLAGPLLLVLDLGLQGKRSADLLQSVFAGQAARFAAPTPVLIVSEPEGKEGLAVASQVLEAVGVRRWEVVLRPFEAEQLEDTILDLLGDPDAVSARKKRLDEARQSNPFVGVVESLKRGEVPLPAAPSVVTQIRKLVAAGNVSAGPLADVVGLDPAVTSGVLKLAGSAIYRGMRRPRNLREAIMRIGAVNVSRIAETVLARGCYVARDPALKERMDQAWRHTLVRAVIMRFAARHEGLDQQDRQYLQGLLADVGEAFLLKLVSERSTTPLRIDDETLNFLADTHTLVGAALLAAWGAPAEVIELARTHHAKVSKSPQALRLFFATSVAHGLGYETPFARVVPMSIDEGARGLLIIDERDRERLKREIEEQLGASVDGAVG